MTYFVSSAIVLKHINHKNQLRMFPRKMSAWWVLPLSILLFLVLSPVDSADEGIRDALVRFMDNLAPQKDANWGWNATSNPCLDRWRGITCDSQSQKVTKIVLEGLDLHGTLDTKSLCEAKSVRVLSLNGNNIGGEIKDDISNCDLLTHLYLRGNKFSGALPRSLSRLRNLKRLDISDNDLTGKLPELGRVSGMLSFLAQDNRLTGTLPDFDFPNFEDFNVSNNDLEGRIPDVQGHFGETSFLGNPRLCGTPLPNDCPNSPKKPSSSSKHWRVDRFLIYLGYVVVGAIILVLIVFKVVKRAPKKERKIDSDVKLGTTHGSSNDTKKWKSDAIRSEYSITSVESGMTATSSLNILNNGQLGVTDLRFEDLLRAPAELLGRGKHGSLYKVSLSSGIVLAVKRIKDFSFSSEEFGLRMEKIGRTKHPNVLSPLAFYCSGQEKLLVYEYLPNGNLFGLLHGGRNGELFDWGSRVLIVSNLAQSLAFMHESLGADQIAHGNLKSTNILFDKDMNPCVSEYGITVTEEHRDLSPFDLDVYGFGVVLLELLTGKMVQNNGSDLARWVQSAVQEEWTVEVFDRVLIDEGASEERMVKMLQVALKCINTSATEKPNMSRVSAILNLIKDEEESSLLLSTEL